MLSSTFLPGSSPPSPGFAPCAILICSSSAFARYQIVTPKRPDAICLIAERRESPSASGLNRAGPSPPSPVLLCRPKRRTTTASVSCAAAEGEPKRSAAVDKRAAAHRASAEARDELAGGNDSVGAQRLRREVVVEQSAQRACSARFLVRVGSELRVRVLVAAPGRDLQREDRVRIAGVAVAGA